MPDKQKQRKIKPLNAEQLRLDKFGKYLTIETLRATPLFRDSTFIETSDPLCPFDIYAYGSDEKPYIIECKMRNKNRYANGERIGRSYVNRHGLLYETKKTCKLREIAKEHNATAVYSVAVPTNNNRIYCYLLPVTHFDKVPHPVRKKNYGQYYGGKKIQHFVQLVLGTYFDYIDRHELTAIGTERGTILATRFFYNELQNDSNK